MNHKTWLVLRKVERAKHHFRDFSSRIDAFFESRPYLTIREEDPKTGDFVWRVYIEKEIPSDFSTIIGDILQNLRSSLDHLAWQLVIANDKIPEIGHTGFPIAKCIEEYKSSFDRKVEGMSQDAKDAIGALKPYQGGNEDLWGLHTLNNSDKHRILLVTGMGHTGTIINIGNVMPFSQRAEVTLPVAPGWAFPLKHGTELFRVSRDEREAGYDENPKFTFQIAFGDAEVMNGEPLLPPLHQLIDFIEGIILSFDSLLK